MTAPQSISSGTEQPLAWHCCDDRYPWIKDIVTTSPTTIDAWRDGGIKFQPLYPRGNAQAGRTWDVAISERVMQLEAAGANVLSISAVLGLISFVRDGEGSVVPSTSGGAEA